jgi:hypothetical protein
VSPRQSAAERRRQGRGGQPATTECQPDLAGRRPRRRAALRWFGAPSGSGGIVRHGRGDSGALLRFARRPPAPVATWRPRSGFRPGFAPSRPETPRGPDVGARAMQSAPPPKMRTVANRVASFASIPRLEKRRSRCRLPAALWLGFAHLARSRSARPARRFCLGPSRSSSFVGSTLTDPFWGWLWGALRTDG